MKFIKDQTYRLQYSVTRVSRRWRNGNPSEHDTRVYLGTYCYIGSRGGKLHFFDQDAGIDVLMTKREAEEAFNKANN